MLPLSAGCVNGCCGAWASAAQRTERTRTKRATRPEKMAAMADVAAWSGGSEPTKVRPLNATPWGPKQSDGAPRRQERHAAPRAQRHSAPFLPGPPPSATLRPLPRRHLLSPARPRHIYRPIAHGRADAEHFASQPASHWISLSSAAGRAPEPRPQHPSASGAISSLSFPPPSPVRPSPVAHSPSSCGPPRPLASRRAALLRVFLTLVPFSACAAQARSDGRSRRLHRTAARRCRSA